jgi:uncharacterized BrkB/YihY/UPF0761 family membrane protein
MFQWIYNKRYYLWGICLLAAAAFVSIIHFVKDWVNSPGNDVSIIFLTSLWMVSALAFYFNAIAHAIYGKKARNHSKIIKGLIIFFFSFVTIAGCSLAILVMIALTIQR